MICILSSSLAVVVPPLQCVPILFLTMNEIWSFSGGKKKVTYALHFETPFYFSELANILQLRFVSYYYIF